MANPLLNIDRDKRVMIRIITIVCILLLTASMGISADANGICGSDSKFATDGNDAAKDCNGPTVLLDFGKDSFKKNSVPSFMYFVPLISPVLVERQTSIGNEQQASVISRDKKVDSENFYVSCGFYMYGNGFHKNTFDHAGMIARNIDNLKDGEPLKNILDYIKFEGEGYGRIEVKGTINDPKETVTEVNVHFNARGQRSPVTVGIYSVNPQNGEYNYENRYNQIVARVNVLTFKRGQARPRMGIKLASVNSNEEVDGYWGHIKGMIANLFIKPLEVEKNGNDAMLDFGYALLKERPAFTFPKAKNIRETAAPAMSDKQK
jgi:hypothetical protein